LDSIWLDAMYHTARLGVEAAGDAFPMVLIGAIVLGVGVLVPIDTCCICSLRISTGSCRLSSRAIRAFCILSASYLSFALFAFSCRLSTLTL
jgi:hypothetical protein